MNYNNNNNNNNNISENKIVKKYGHLTLRAHSGKSYKKGYRMYKYTAKKAHKLALTRTKQAKHTTKFAYLIEWVNKNIEYDDSMYTIREKFIKNNPDENVPCETTLY